MEVAVKTGACMSCKAPVKMSPPTNQYPAFLQAGCPSCHPTNSVKALQGSVKHRLSIKHKYWNNSVYRIKWKRSHVGIHVTKNLGQNRGPCRLCKKNFTVYIESRNKIRVSRLRWFGHVERKDGNDWVKRCITWEVEGISQRGPPQKTWWDYVKNDMESLGLSQIDAQSRNEWRRRFKGTTG